MGNLIIEEGFDDSHVIVDLSGLGYISGDIEILTNNKHIHLDSLEAVGGEIFIVNFDNVVIPQQLIPQD